jgi:hypothetical protein
LQYVEEHWQFAQQLNPVRRSGFSEETQYENIKAIDSNMILFGSHNGRLFEIRHSDPNEYEQMKKELLVPYQQACYQKTLKEVFGLAAIDQFDPALY